MSQLLETLLRNNDFIKEVEGTTVVECIKSTLLTKILDSYDMSKLGLFLDEYKERIDIEAINKFIAKYHTDVQSFIAILNTIKVRYTLSKRILLRLTLTNNPVIFKYLCENKFFDKFILLSSGDSHYYSFVGEDHPLEIVRQTVEIMYYNRDNLSYRNLLENLFYMNNNFYISININGKSFNNGRREFDIIDLLYGSLNIQRVLAEYYDDVYSRTNRFKYDRLSIGKMIDMFNRAEYENKCAVIALFLSPIDIDVKEGQKLSPIYQCVNNRLFDINLFYEIISYLG